MSEARARTRATAVITVHKYEPATNDVHFCAVVAEVDVATGRTLKFEQIITPKF